MEWQLLLMGYIESEQKLEELNDIREEQREIILSNHYKSFDDDIESYTSVSTEDTAIRLIELDKYIGRAYERYNRKLQTLHKALDTLSFEELLAFERVAWGIYSHVPKRYERKALNKVCNLIEKLKDDELESKEQARKAEIEERKKAIREHNTMKQLMEA